jgi:ferredoxin
MSIFTIDTSECTSCGTCVSVCPARIIELDADKRPKVIDGREESCINCGHCSSICPKGALSLASMPIETLKELPSGWRLDPETVEPFLKGRRSIRAYKKDIVEKSVIEKMIDIARYAPTGINRQSVYWAIVHDPKKVEELAGLTVEWMRGLIVEKSPIAESLGFDGIVKAHEKGADPICRRAPHAAIVYGLKEDMLSPAACTIAMAHFELAAIPFGLGACWAGYLQMALNGFAPLRKSVGLSIKTACHGAMLFGYPEFEYMCIPNRNPPRVIWR